MPRTAITGAALAAAGAGKFSQTLAEAGRQAHLADFLAFRCGGPSLLPGAQGGDSLMLAGLHCWGCYALLAGAGCMALALWQGLSRPGPPARSRPR